MPQRDKELNKSDIDVVFLSVIMDLKHGSLPDRNPLVIL